MAQHDPRPLISRRVDVYRTYCGGLEQRFFELREVMCARGARCDVRRDHVVLVLIEGAERVCREIFGRVTVLAHRSS
jgi:hypothetical protein